MHAHKYVKRPVVVEAVRYDGSNAAEVIAWAGKGQQRERIDPDTAKHFTALSIPTMEGLMSASPGDWIIRGVVGEVYPCKPDVFELTYERVERVEEAKAAGFVSDDVADQ